jgi:hypothetical protein
MTRLVFEVVGAHPERYAAEPTLMLELQITEADGRAVHAVALKCQVRIEPQRRRYEPAEEARLLELFGETPRWGTRCARSVDPRRHHVARFTGTTTIDLPITCTYDFEIAASKYLRARRRVRPAGAVLLRHRLHRTETGSAPPPCRGIKMRVRSRSRRGATRWTCTSPTPGGRVSRDTLDALQRYKAEQALPTWDQTFERL